MTRIGDLVRRLLRSVLFRVLVTAGLLAVVLAPLDWQQIGDRVSSGRPMYALAAVALIVMTLVIGGWRWSLLLRIAALTVPARQIYRVYAVTSFANAFLPTAIGGDVARPLLISRGGPQLTRAATTVVLDRAFALAGLLGVAWIGVLSVGPGRLDGSFWALTAVSAAAIALGALAVGVLRGRLPAVGRIVPERARPVLRESRTVALAVLHNPRALLLITAQSLVFQTLVTFQIVLLAKTLRLDLSFGLAAVALALVTLATLLPVTIGGFGIREGSYVAILSAAGISHGDAVLISLLSVVVLLATLPGAWELIRGGFAPVLLHHEPPGPR